MTPESLRNTRAACGTRARYVAGCRCEACRQANLAAYRERTRRVAAARAEVVPTGPPIPGEMQRAGRTCKILRCPGANGEECVREDGPAWLRVGKVCTACVDRAAVWNGTVSPARARWHLRGLRTHGVGLRAAAEASGVALSVLRGVMHSDDAIRAGTERKILAIDRGAAADHALIPSGPSRQLLEKLQRKGFTKLQLGRLLDPSGHSVQYAARPLISVRSAHKIERLWAKAQAGKIAPDPGVVEARAEQDWVRTLLAAGITPASLTRRLGFGVSDEALTRPRMRKVNRDAIRALRADLARLLRADGEDADDMNWSWWQVPEIVTAAGLETKA